MRAHQGNPIFDFLLAKFSYNFLNIVLVDVGCSRYDHNINEKIHSFYEDLLTNSKF